jgi:hypothetical protein
MTPEEMLERRHDVKLKWVEPWPAVGPEGNELDAFVEHHATVHDCINIQRRAHQFAGGNMGDDLDRLVEFIAVHWASIVEK